jgi:hypothetical protein
MNVVTLHRLVDGPISLDAARQERIQKVAEMAAVLVLHGAYVDYSDSIMTLLASGYSTFEVHALVTDARQVATEHVVAMEMSQP